MYMYVRITSTVLKKIVKKKGDEGYVCTFAYFYLNETVLDITRNLSSDGQNNKTIII